MSRKTTIKSPPWKTLSNDKMAQFYTLLVHNSYGDSARMIGLDKFYNDKSLRIIGYYLYNKIVTLGPESLGISADVVTLVKQAVIDRKSFNGNKPMIKNTEQELALQWGNSDLLDVSDTRAMVVGARNKAAVILHKKFDLINSSKKALKETSLSQLSQAFSILFDKAQIINGEATENISVLSKNIKINMTAEESLDAILRMREQEVASSNK